MDEEQCCICHESLQNGKQIFELECKHKFHSKCWNEYTEHEFSTNRLCFELKCPLCRHKYKVKYLL